MKRIFFTLSLFSIFLFSCSNKQKPRDTSNIKSEETQSLNQEKKEYKEAATNIVYKLTIYLFKDGLISKDKLDKSLKDSLNTVFEKYNKSERITDRIDSIEKLLREKPLSLKNSVSLIDNNKKKIENQRSVKDIDKLSVEITKILEKEENVFRKDSSKNPSRYKLYEKYKKEIGEIKTNIQKNEKQNAQENKKVGNSKNSSTKIKEIKSSIPTWLYVILVVLLVLLAGTIFFIKKIYNSLELLKTKRVHDKQKFNDLKYNYDRLNNKVAGINLDALRDEMYEQMNILARRINDMQSEQVRDVRSAPQAKPEPKIFYAQYPDSADPLGFKNIQFDSNSKMVYRITRIEGNKARFIIQPDENTQQYAIGNHGKILKPVCEYLNQPSSMNRTIKVFREGRLEMQNNIWIVVEKLKIKFE